MYLWGKIPELVWLLQSCAKDAKIIEASEQNNVAFEEQWGHLTVALNEDAKFLVHLKKLGTERLLQVWAY